MNFSIPKSLAISFIGILSIPAIAFASFQYIYPTDPDLTYTKHGDLTVEWVKLSEGDNFTEYVAKEKTFDEETLVANILVMRNYQKPQSSIYDHEQVRYSSMVSHQTVNCRSRTVAVQDLMLFSNKLSKGNLVKDLYELDYDSGEAQPGTIAEKKVVTLCGFTS
ncbi:hypothetical protein LZG75_12065 [Polynucleobacter sp. IMCC30063]|uniref:surface-adhesin E family protein n=1 Tax=Polynucleobacter sp. IMCC30063 TaxID=2907298 RepID=UPI001F3013D0|nr:surface-adhesin E family protein [Polynucleobacter sp. IMCC30063]MCE7506964.1 hypothetical protein [Polynucleobacter sp. IMCC30063]